MGLTIKTSVVVDDDPHITELFSEILGIHGLEILDVGHDGLQAIELFVKHKPDILFLDVEMPKLNGIEALKEIMKIDPTANIVIVTGNTSAECENVLEENGASAIVFKPFDIQKIKQVIAHLNTAPPLAT